MEQLIGSRLRKEYNRAVCGYPVCLTYSEQVMRNTRVVTSWNQDSWERHQQPQICRWYHSNGRKWRGNKEPLDEGEGETERASLRLNIKRNTKIMASTPITAWQTGEKVEVVTDFLFLGSKITADGDCSHEIRRQLLIGRKVMTNLDSMVKSRDITLPKKVHKI